MGHQTFLEYSLDDTENVYMLKIRNTMANKIHVDP